MWGKAFWGKWVMIIVALGGLAVFSYGCGSSGSAGAEGGTTPDPSNPNNITKYAEQLVIPPVMPPEVRRGQTADYEIAVRQIDQQVLPSGFPMTTVFAYGRANDASSFHYPAFTMETRTNDAVQVTWINDLVDENGHFLPHLLPIDQTLHWANPPGPVDSRTPEVALYTGPVPIVTHVHGSHVPAISDGFPEAWYLPDAEDIPAGYHTQGTMYDSVLPTDPGRAVFEYPNDQRATTLWYHDHTLGMTRANVYAGLAGFWIVRDAIEDALNLPGPAPQEGDAPGTHYYEVPIVIQDRSFNSDGTLFYPDSREYFDGYAGPYIPESDVSPHWNPEFFGNAIVVNGRTWPNMNVEPRLYRFRLLNGSNARFLILKFNADGLMFHQIGSDGGLLPDTPVVSDELLLAPAERADVIVDFSNFQEGDEIVLLNLGPDEPYKGPNPLIPQDPADPLTTGQIMKFKIVPLTGNGNPGQIPTVLPSITALETTLPPRDLTLNEVMSATADIPVEAMLGTGADGPLTWMDPATETPHVGDTETWRVINLTEDAHPVHLHLVQFQVVGRIPFDADGYAFDQAAYLDGLGPLPDIADYYTGAAMAPEASESGSKDTVIANPGEVTLLIANFDLEGLFVWHCHILEHEDNEMMRPYEVLPAIP